MTAAGRWKLPTPERTAPFPMVPGPLRRRFASRRRQHISNGNVPEFATLVVVALHSLGRRSCSRRSADSWCRFFSRADGGFAADTIHIFQYRQLLPPCSRLHAERLGRFYTRCSPFQSRDVAV